MEESEERDKEPQFDGSNEKESKVEKNVESDEPIETAQCGGPKLTHLLQISLLVK